MINPCVELCYRRFSKQYTKECDDNCEFAKVVKENKELKSELDKIKSRMIDDGK